MAFELLLGTGGNDQISHLRRQETPQPAHALDFAYLVGDALFEVLIEFDNILSFFAEFAEQPLILNGDDGLICEIRDQRDLFVVERPNLLPEDADNPNQFIVLDHWHAERGPNASDFHCLYHSG